MTQIILGRVTQGFGGAGMVSMVSILLTGTLCPSHLCVEESELILSSDIVPLRDVAAYRSYVNVVQTVGRSCGGSIGGYLAQVIGWRW